MKKKSTSKSAFFNIRIIVAALLCLVGVAVALLGMGAFSSLFAQPKGTGTNQSATNQDSPGSQTPDVIRLVGPVRLDQDLRTLSYVPNEGENEERRLTINPFPLSGGPRRSGSSSAFPQSQSLLQKIFRPVPNMPPPLLTFDGTNRDQSGCLCRPPDTDGDVGPNHYIQTVNTGFRVFDKSGNPLTPFTTYNSLFNGTGTPCDDANQGDPIVFYDQLADRWVVSDFAFPAFPGNSFWQCIAVSQSPDPVAGPWIQYALQIDPANPTFLGDYPKFGLWNNPQPGGAYYLTVNLFSPGFQGNRVFALDRGSMLSGGPANAIAFTIPVAAMPTTFSAPIPAGFRTGNPPPAGRDEFLLTVDSPNSGGVVLTQVHGWFFHADFVTQANSTFGVGPNHLPNAEITVNGFVDAFTDTTTNLVPQSGMNPPLDTLGDRIMTPVVYQNRNGTESLWADHTIILNYPNGPTAVRWYQFNVTGGNFPATPVQQQDWTNGNDGLFRWMPSLAVDQNGNMAIGYSTSSANDFPDIRYSGRFASDPPNDLGQGEATMFDGTGSQTSASGRWGDYSMTTIDPADNVSFWHTNEYYVTTGITWSTRIGKFQFPAGSPTPTPTATATATATPAPRSTPTPRPRPTPPPRP